MRKISFAISVAKLLILMRQNMNETPIFWGLLRMTLEASKPEFGDYLLLPSKVKMRGERLHYALANEKDLDILWGNLM